jgi:hypothetical protein
MGLKMNQFSVPVLTASADEASPQVSTSTGILNKTVLQHTLRFIKVRECLQTCRLVSKSWKDAVETMRFDASVLRGNRTFEKLIEIFQHTCRLPYFEKYLKAFKSAHIPMSLITETESYHFMQFVVSHMKNMVDIEFDDNYESLLPQHENFMRHIMQNSNKTLQRLALPKFIMHNISFPKLSTLQLIIGVDIKLNAFETFFPDVLPGKTMPKVGSRETIFGRPILICC